MRILVLGAGGQVGSELGTQLHNVLSPWWQGYSVTLADRSNVDVADLQGLRDFLEYQKPNWIINATAYTAVDKAETEVSQAYSVNEHAVRILAEYCATNNSNLMHISTDYVFDGGGEFPFYEDSVVEPLGVYGASKLAGEEAIKSTLSRYIILRTSWVFGARGDNFVKTMMRLAEYRSEIGIVGDQLGAPTSARSIANAIATIMTQMYGAESVDARWGTYHFTGDPFVSWAQFATEIFRQAEQQTMINRIPIVTAISTEQYPTLAKRPKNSRLDCSKIARVFGIERDRWHQSLAEMLNEIKSESA